jgi:hypothetical protein
VAAVSFRGLLGIAEITILAGYRDPAGTATDLKEANFALAWLIFSR